MPTNPKSLQRPARFPLTEPARPTHAFLALLLLVSLVILGCPSQVQRSSSDTAHDPGPPPPPAPFCPPYDPGKLPHDPARESTASAGATQGDFAVGANGAATY